MSWWNNKVYNELKKHKISFCGVSHPKLSDDVIKNNSILYYRFHGVPVLYKSEYEEDFINDTTFKMMNASRFKQAYVYFNNTWGTGAIINTRQMQTLLHKILPQKGLKST